VVSAEQAAALRRLEQQLGTPEPAEADDEKLRFISGFGDIFVTIGIVLFLGFAQLFRFERRPDHGCGRDGGDELGTGRVLHAPAAYGAAEHRAAHQFFRLDLQPAVPARRIHGGRAKRRHT